MHHEPLTYRPSELTPGVVHIGLGGFARGFVLDYFHDIAKQGHKNWAVVGVKPRTEHEPHWTNAKHAYHLVTRNGSDHSREIGSLHSVIGGKTHAHDVVTRLASADTKIVTLTVKEAGYCLDRHKNLDFNKRIGNEFVVENDLIAIKKRDYQNVSTVPGWIVASLYERHLQNRPVPTIMSLDNLPRNGEVTRKAVLDMASHLGWHFGNYASEVQFPISVVDRIVPEQSHACASIVEKPIFAEEHRDFFIEDKFAPRTKPPLDAVGAQYVVDIRPYEDMKLRMVNGGHLALAVVAKVMGEEIVHDAISKTKNPSLRRYLETFLTQAANAIDPKPPSLDLHERAGKILERFGNERLPDKVDRLLTSTDIKMEPRLFNAAALEFGMPSNASAFAVAAWLQYMSGRDDAGQEYQFKGEDVKATRIKQPDELVNRLTNTNAPWEALSQFSNDVFRHRELIREKGMRAALDQVFPGRPVVAANASWQTCEA